MEQREQAHKGTWGRGDWVWLSRWGGCPVRGSPEAPAVVFLPLRPTLSQQVSWLAEPQGHVRSERASRISSRGEPGTIVHCWKGKWAVLGSRVPGSWWDPQLQSPGSDGSGPPLLPTRRNLGSDLDVELDERGAALRPAGEAASGPAATTQQLLAEVRALAQHQGVVEAAPQGDGALEIMDLRAQGGVPKWGTPRD